MGNPTGTDLYVSYPLSSISINYFQDQQEFIADRVFPVVPVERQGGLYWTFAKGPWMRSEAKVRAPGSETPGGGWTQTQASYFALPYGFHKDNTDQDYSNVGAPLNLDTAATMYVSRQIALARELVFVQNYFGTGKWNTDLTGVSTGPTGPQFLQWNAANSTPIEDIQNQSLAIQQATGFRPNKLILGPQTWQALRNNAELINRISVAQTRILTQDLFASLVDVDEVLIPHVIQDTANEGATDVFSFAYGKSALLVYAAPAPGLNTVSGGYVFAWTGYLGDQAFGARMKRYRMENIASWRIEGEAAFDMKIVGADLGTFFATAVA